MPDSNESPQTERMDATATAKPSSSQSATEGLASKFVSFAIANLVAWSASIALAVGMFGPIIFAVFAILLWLQATSLILQIGGLAVLTIGVVVGALLFRPWLAPGP